ncbi:MAG: M23 family metallopeptidase [Sphingobium sp.]|nr:M23 family metallopeptidase [Sphingobium sp.]
MFTVFTAHSRGLVRGAFLALIGLMTAAASPAMAEDAAAHDAQFSSLFSTWVKMNNGTEDNASTRASIPSREPVDTIDRLSSNFGARTDPFNGHKRMHQGVDIAGPLGTPVYATADGVVAVAEFNNGGYGNLVEIDHGNGLQTRYGHLSRLIAQPNEFVRRGQLIGLMGSTGRSTGSHLHYEVRIDGNAVNPLPYIDGTNYEIALANAKSHVDMDDVDEIAMGGPEAKKSSDFGGYNRAPVARKTVVHAKAATAKSATHKVVKKARRHR